MNPLDYVYFKLDEWAERKYRKIDNEYYDVVVTPELVAERFKLLFKLHGVEISEIPELQICKDKGFTLYDLNSNDRLLKKLDPDFIKELANYFQVRIEWLRSGEPDMYMHRSWYKDWLYKFFNEWKEIDSDELHDPFYILTTTDKLDVHSDEYQPFILVLKKPLAEVDEKDIYQYRFESVWDWHHPPCRLQAKGIATKYYELTRRMIPMYTTSKENFYKVKQGYIPPNVGGRNHKVSFEEYAVIKNSFFPLYEEDEHSAVLEEMKYYKIDSIARESIGQPRSDEFSFNNTGNGEPDSKPKQSATRGRKKSKEKKEIKDRFLNGWVTKIKNEEISCAEAARQFYFTLSPEEEVLLFRSKKDFDRYTPEIALENAVRTLQEYYRENKKSQ